MRRTVKSLNPTDNPDMSSIVSDNESIQFSDESVANQVHHEASTSKQDPKMSVKPKKTEHDQHPTLYKNSNRMIQRGSKRVHFCTNDDSSTDSSKGRVMRKKLFNKIIYKERKPEEETRRVAQNR